MLYGLASQFVTIKIDNTSSEWQGWAREYRHEGNTIPIVYVVRADGEKLYAKSTSAKGELLPNLLAASLKESGRIFSAREMETLQKTLKMSAEAMEQKDYAAAIRSFSRMKRVGVPGNLQSFAGPAVELDKLATEIVELAREEFKAIESDAESLDNASPQSLANAAIRISNYQSNFKSYSVVKMDVRAIGKILTRNKELAQAIRDYEGLVRVEKMKVPESRRETYLAKIKEIAATYPGTVLEEKSIGLIDRLSK